MTSRTSKPEPGVDASGPAPSAGVGAESSGERSTECERIVREYLAAIDRDPRERAAVRQQLLEDHPTHRVELEQYFAGEGLFSVGLGQGSRLITEVARFSQAWRDGRPLAIAKVLESAPVANEEAREELLGELVKAELLLKWEETRHRPELSGPRIEDYLALFPELV